MQIKPALESVSIVLVGELNPAIFSPAWFARRGIWNDAEEESATVKIIHPEIAQFNNEWCTISVEQKRFIVRSLTIPHVRIFDLINRTFGEFVPHTPLQKLGINRMVHFDSGSPEARDRIGDTLAPRSAWGAWTSALMTTKDHHHGGMRSITMEQSCVDDREVGFIRAKVEPSTEIKPLDRGVLIEINDHYELSNYNASTGSEAILEILQDHFSASLERSDWIIDQVMSLQK